MSIELRIKFLSLSEEQRLIKNEEARIKRIRTKKVKAGKAVTTWDAVRERIYRHRMDDLKPEARATHLSRAFLSGRAYNTVEARRYSQPNWDRISRLVEKYGRNDPRNVRQSFEQWMQAAKDTPTLIYVPREKRPHVKGTHPELGKAKE